MATKNNPGEFDCYANAKPDEPMFVLLARDAKAPTVVRYWGTLYVNQCRHEQGTSLRPGLDLMTDDQRRKYREALNCADAMEEWRARCGRGRFEGQESITYHQLTNAIADHLMNAGLGVRGDISVEAIAKEIWNFARVVK